MNIHVDVILMRYRITTVIVVLLGLSILAPVSAYELNGSFTLLDGTTSTFFDEFQGDYVLVDAFASWCEPCKKAMPELAILKEERGDIIEIFSLSIETSDTTDLLQDFADDYGMTWTIGIDSESEFFNNYPVGNIPTYFIFNPDGELLTSFSVAEAHTASEFIALVDKHVLNIDGSSLVTDQSTTSILWQSILLGLLASFSPCLFPLMPSYLAIVANDNNAGRGKIFLSMLLLGAGIMIVFTLFGLLFNVAIGSFLIRNFGIFAIFQSILLITIGLLMIKTPQFIYNIQLPSSLNNILYKDGVQSRIGLLSFLVGLFYTIIALPCAFGYFILSWSLVLEATLIVKLFAFLAFTIGAIFPFMVIGLFIPELKSNFSGKIQQGSNYLKIALGFIILILGGYFLYTYRNVILILF